RPLPALKELKLQKRVQPSSLFLGSRKAIEDEPSLRIRLTQTPGNDIANQIVGNQLPARNQRLHLQSQWRSLLYMLAQQIAGRNLRDAVVLADPLRLGAFTCARWPEEHDWSDVSQSLLRHRTGP